MPEPTVVAAVSIIGAIAAAATATRRPFVALGILFVLASTSRVTLDTPIGTMRLEQPAIAAVALVLLGHRAVAALPSGSTEARSSSRPGSLCTSRF